MATNGKAADVKPVFIPEVVPLEGQTSAVDWLTVTAKPVEFQQLMYEEAARQLDILKNKGFVQRDWHFHGYDGWSCDGFRWGRHPFSR